jgi:hypothetical protein
MGLGVWNDLGSKRDCVVSMDFDACVTARSDGPDLRAPDETDSPCPTAAKSYPCLHETVYTEAEVMNVCIGAHVAMTENAAAIHLYNPPWCRDELTSTATRDIFS